VSETAGALRACRACGEAIPAQARVCKVCTSPQGWTRLLFQWKEIGIAVFALVPLWKAAGSLADLARPAPKVPEVRASALGCSADSFRLALTNVGTAPGLVSGVRLAYRSGDTRIEQPGVELVPDGDDASLVLEPGKVATLALSPHITGTRTTLQFPTSGGDCQAIAVVAVTTFDQHDSAVEAACPCP
jgi:hypothetical protein